MVTVPSSAVLIDGVPRIGWYEMDPATGETIGVLESGQHQALAQYIAMRDASNRVNNGVQFAQGMIAGLTLGTFTKVVAFLLKGLLNFGVNVVDAVEDTFIGALKNAVTSLVNYQALALAIQDVFFNPFYKPFAAGFLTGFYLSLQLTSDPPAQGLLYDPHARLVPSPRTAPGQT